MKTRIKGILAALAVVLVAVAGTACNAAAETPAPAKEYYQVHHTDGRIYVFGMEKIYRDFLEGKELAYVLTKIAAGPNRETVVFGLSKDDSKKAPQLPQVATFEGKLEGAAEGFYGEIIKDNRHYVFDRWAEMKDFRTSGEAPYVFTFIGQGPNRATVAYVRNKSQSKEQPVALMEQFRKVHGL